MGYPHKHVADGFSQVMFPSHFLFLVSCTSLSVSLLHAEDEIEEQLT